MMRPSLLYINGQLAANIVMEIIIEMKRFQFKHNCLLNGIKYKLVMDIQTILHVYNYYVLKNQYLCYSFTYSLPLSILPEG